MSQLATNEEKKLLKKYPELLSPLRRLEGITGFVSILGDDPRVQVFRRSYHVHRVVWFTDWLCQKFPDADREQAILTLGAMILIASPSRTTSKSRLILIRQPMSRII
jgi:hypothetical protein